MALKQDGFVLLVLSRTPTGYIPTYCINKETRALTRLYHKGYGVSEGGANTRVVPPILADASYDNDWPHFRSATVRTCAVGSRSPLTHINVQRNSPHMMSTIFAFPWWGAAPICESGELIDRT